MMFRILKKRKNQNINVYREIIGPLYSLNTYSLIVDPIKKSISPFKNFDADNPKWFKCYSKYKHNKLKLIKEWNLEYSLLALGALFILVLRHPNRVHNDYMRHFNIESEIFTYLNPENSKIQYKLIY